MSNKLLFFLFLLVFSNSLLAQEINGTIVDANNMEPLPFATVSFTNQLTGTVSNIEGQFSILNENPSKPDTLQINFIGYESFKLITSAIKGDLNVKLKPTSVLFDEVLIEPKEPTWYIKEVIKERANNYPDEKYQTIAYYNELIKEDDHFTKYTEAVIKSNHPAYTDTSKSIHQLILLRTANDLQEMQFMKSKMDKKNLKKKKKADKKGEEYDDKSEAITASFGGPNSILSLDIIKSGEAFLDSTKFKDYSYSFGGASEYRNLNIIIIKFQSKKTIDNLRQSGNLYINTNRNVIVGIDFNATIVIPALAKPILFAMGLKVENPRLATKLRFRNIDEIWYPEIFQIKVNGDITKKYLFQKNESASFEIEQVLTMNQIKPGISAEIPKEKRFDAKKDMLKQVYKDEGLEWDQINTMKISY